MALNVSKKKSDFIEQIVSDTSTSENPEHHRLFQKQIIAAEEFKGFMRVIAVTEISETRSPLE
jgi:hypothetical protein